MLIGIMSDSHDNVQGVKDALKIFSTNDVKLVLHAGDMIGSGNCHIFKDCRMALKLVYGNNDGDRLGLWRNFKGVGGEYLGDFGEIEVEGLKIAILHGTEESMVKAVVASQLYNIVVRGHNHRSEITQNGKTLLVNPGEVWGHLTGLSSVAILETSNLNVEIINLRKYETIREMQGN